MRVLGVDFGSKRIGIAVGGNEPLIITAQPNLQPSGTLKKDALAIFELAKKWQAELVVVGVPYNDQDSRMERVCLQLVERIRELGMAVHPIDESMTSLEAEQAMREGEGTAALRKKWIDGEAARRIVERFFAQKED